jgi:protein phosphatase 2C family protein 2/3
MRGKAEIKTPNSKLPPMNNLLNSDSHVIPRPLGSKSITIDTPSRASENKMIFHKRIEDSNDKNMRSTQKQKQGLKIETTNEPKNYGHYFMKDIQPNTTGAGTTVVNLSQNVNTNKSTVMNNSLTIGSQSTKGNYRIRGVSPKKYINLKYGGNHPPQNEVKSFSQDFANLKIDRPDPTSATVNKSRNGTMTIDLPVFEATKCSNRKNGVVKAYAANTNQGIVRNYNEDRVAIILNIMKPPNIEYKEEWPVCSFFGVYDGHGGTSCADYLRDNLHQFVIRDKNFPHNPKEALRKGFEQAERQFGELAQQNPSELDRSGSCAIVTLIVADTLYVANVGDSRAVMSCDMGRKVVPLSNDHKPMDEDEHQRIMKAGGKIYQSQIPQTLRPAFGSANSPGMNRVILGPHRVLPGRLSVSRTFGDMEAKLPKYGGNPNVVIAEPEIRSMKLTKECDFIVLACDGIFDKMNNPEVVKSCWDSTQIRASDVHHQCSIAVESLMRESLIRRTLDNITVVMISLSGFKRALFPKASKTTTHTPGLPIVRQAQTLEPIQETTSSTGDFTHHAKPSSSYSTNKLKKIIDVGSTEEKVNGIHQRQPSRTDSGVRKSNNNTSTKDSYHYSNNELSGNNLMKSSDHGFHGRNVKS